MRTLAAVIFFFGVSLGVSAQVPSGQDCEFYSALESVYRCGARGYLLQYGERLCLRYLRAQPRASVPVASWFPRVRLCLQERLSGQQFSSCSELRRLAFASHVPCYVETGFCRLSWSSRWEILGITRADALTPAALATAWQIQEQCGRI